MDRCVDIRTLTIGNKKQVSGTKEHKGLIAVEVCMALETDKKSLVVLPGRTQVKTLLIPGI